MISALRKACLPVAAILLCLWAAPAAADHDDAPLHYVGSLSVQPETESLQAGWTVVIQDTSLDSVTLALGSSFGTAQLSGPDMDGVTTRLDPRFEGAVTLYQVGLKPAGDTKRDRVVKMAYGGPLYRGVPPLPINTVDPSKIELTVDSFWFPFDARFDTDLTAQLYVEVPGDWTAVGRESVEPRGNGYLFRQTRPAMDIALTLLADPLVVRKPGYIVYDVREEPGSKLAELGEALSFCTAFLNDLAGEAGPLPEASVVVTGRADGSYSRGTLIALSDIENEDAESLHQFVCHELAHYWSHANPGGPENWINEGVADYLGNMGVRAALGEAVFAARMARYREQLAEREIGPIWTPDATDRQDYLILYRAGPVAFQELEARMSRTLFQELMQAVMVERTATTADLLDLIERLSDGETRNWFAARLSE